MRGFGVFLGNVVLVLFTAACAGGISTPAESRFIVAATSKNSMGRTLAPPQLYISNLYGSVLVFSTGSNPTLVQTITNGVAQPGGIWVDKRGTLYAVNLPQGSYQTSLTEYRPGAGSPFRTITDGIVNCANVAVDKHGNVYVTGVNTSNKSLFLEIYLKGQLSPAKTLTIPSRGAVRVTGLAFDSSGALLVGETVYLKPGVVYRLAPGSQTFTNLNLQNAPGGTIAVDKVGNLYAGSGTSASSQAIAVYSPNSTSPSRVIRLQNVLEALTVEPSGVLYAATSGHGHTRILAYAPGGNTPMQTFEVAASVDGLALSP